MSATTQRRLATGLKWVARVFGLAGVVFYLGLLWGSGMSNQDWAVVGGQITFAIGIALTVVGLIISWWKMRLAGLLLIFSFLSPLCLFIYSAAKHIDASPLIFGLPSLVTGVLFLLSWYFSTKAS
jgi:hypothetical protein